MIFKSLSISKILFPDQVHFLSFEPKTSPELNPWWKEHLVNV